MIIVVIIVLIIIMGVASLAIIGSNGFAITTEQKKPAAL